MHQVFLSRILQDIKCVSEAPGKGTSTTVDSSWGLSILHSELYGRHKTDNALSILNI